MKKLFLFALLIIVTSVFFAIGINASDTECEHKYLTTALSFDSDFCLNGGTRTLTCEGCEDIKTEKFESFASLVGYSASNTSIVATYSISDQALKEYAKMNNLKLNYGFVVASEKNIEAYGNPINPESGYVGKNMLKYDMLYYSSAIQDVVISNVKYDANSTQNPLDSLLYIAYYVLIDDKVYYIQDDITESYKDFTYVSFNMIKQSFTDFSGFSTEETELSKDRLNQIESSNLSYNTGSDLDEKRLNEIETAAELLSIGGTVFNFPNASLMLSHFLSGSGKNYTLDINILLKDKIALSNRNSDLNNALYACEVLANQGQSLSFNQSIESLHHNLTGDFWYAMGSYFTRIEITDLTLSYNRKGEMVYNATFKYIVEDYYNFDTNDTSDLFPSISPNELHELHKAGLAKEFLTHGEKIYNLTWTAGQRVEDLRI